MPETSPARSVSVIGLGYVGLPVALADTEQSSSTS